MVKENSCMTWKIRDFKFKSKDITDKGKENKYLLQNIFLSK